MNDNCSRLLINATANHSFIADLRETHKRYASNRYWYFTDKAYLPDFSASWQHKKQYY